MDSFAFSRKLALGAMLLLLPTLAKSAPSFANPAFQTSPAERQPYLGSWQREVTDATGSTKIFLELRADGTYTKTLDAVLRGKSFHGDEQGSWAANGPLVLLSGNEKSSPSRHDLRSYRKVR